MPMHAAELRAALEKLRAEVHALDPADHEGKQTLESLILELERKLEDPSDAAHHESLVGSVRKAIERFEVEHPSTTQLLNNIMVSLHNMGI